MAEENLEETQETNPMLEVVDWENPQSFGGLMVNEVRLYPEGTEVRRLAPLKDDEQQRQRFQVSDSEGNDIATYTQGDDLFEILPESIHEMLEEVFRRVKPHYEKFMACNQALKDVIVQRELLSKAIAEKCDADEIQNNRYKDFRGILFNGHLSILQAEMGQHKASAEASNAYIQAAYMTIVHNVTAFLGCTLPVEVKTTPYEGGMRVDVIVGAIPVTNEGSYLDYKIDLDVRWGGVLFTSVVFPDMVQSESFLRTFNQVMRGGSPSGLILTQ